MIGVNNVGKSDVGWLPTIVAMATRGLHLAQVSAVISLCSYVVIHGPLALNQILKRQHGSYTRPCPAPAPYPIRWSHTPDFHTVNTESDAVPISF
ncbi:hypothetical protein BofuT4_P160990.1 [Botrytis cinerea T4]|uniref:Uncharacterized protein n=1 Tax=Botryotinia fuckeliana (strain T4) TaxID=999810 RepID=G2YTQ0_BOTF4|nr:hypothetical protein BofuT4_P160990.1 [Botrytis cinerea T4]